MELNEKKSREPSKVKKHNNLRVKINIYNKNKIKEKIINLEVSKEI